MSRQQRKGVNEPVNAAKHVEEGEVHVELQKTQGEGGVTSQIAQLTLLDDFCPRTVSFTIPGKVGVQITATENAGSIDFVVDVLGSGRHAADLRGLFFQFDESKIGGLQITGGDGLIAGTQINPNKVIDLGQGANMHGKANPFDVGIAFGSPGKGKDFVDGPVHFTLSNAGAALTLDDFAHLQFGARLTSTGDKITTIAPAAPDAIDDTISIFEDGSSGFDAPSTIPAAVLFNVLANDQSETGALSVIAFHDGPSHGTVSIAPNGDVLYTPDEDYSGTDSFEYCAADAQGGQDHAVVNVSIAAVADLPDLAVQVSAGANVNEINLHVTATMTDADASEFIDRFEFAGLPAGVTILGAASGVYDDPGTPGTLAADFTLVLQPSQDYDFDLSVKAYSKEFSNGDEEVATQTIDVIVDAKTTSGSLAYATEDQSIWNTGSEFVLDDHRFLGIDEGFDESESLGPLSIHVGASLKTGFQSDLHFEGGEIDATLPYDLTINTTYNKTTDVLLIDPNAAMGLGGHFATTGPEGSYKLDFIFNYFLGATVELDAVVDTINIYGAEIGDTNTENIVDISSNDTLEIPFPFGLTGTVRWPDVDTASNPGSGTLTSTGASNDFLHLNLDVDQALADIFLAGVNPFEIPFDFEVVDGTVQLVDLDLFGGLNFIQNFTLQAPTLEGNIVFENGAVTPFSTLSDVVLSNASSYDSDHDGMVEFDLVLKPDATLQNDTDLGINLGYNFDLLRVTGSYDIGVDSDTFDFAAVDEGGDLQVATIDLFSEPAFDIDFQTQSFAVFA